MKIKIVVPEANSRWKIQIGNSNFSRLNPIATYRLVERCLNGKDLGKLGTPQAPKINLSVEYGQMATGGMNEGAYDKIDDALYALACFLENDLSLAYQREKYRKYNADY